MVHALEEIQRLLKPDGCLIDIHPLREAPLIKVYQGRNLLFAESNPGYDYEADLRHAENALEEVVQRGLFLIEGRGEFDIITYASSVVELRDFWAKVNAYEDNPKDDAATARQAEVYARADEIMQNVSGAEIAYHERGRITRLKPNATAEIDPAFKALQRAQEKTRAQLDSAAFEAARAECQKMTLEPTLALATENESVDAQAPNNR